MHGVTTNQLVWENVSQFLSDPQTFLTEMDRQRRDSDSGEATVPSKITAFKSKLRNVDKMETELVGMKLRGQASDEAFERQGALLRAERVYYQDEIGRQKAERQTLTQATEGLETVTDLRDKIVDRLENATTKDRRCSPYPVRAQPVSLPMKPENPSMSAVAARLARCTVESRLGNPGIRLWVVSLILAPVPLIKPWSRPYNRNARSRAGIKPAGKWDCRFSIISTTCLVSRF